MAQKAVVPTTLSIDGVEYIRKDSINTLPVLSEEVIVRTYSAGVHVGTLVSRNGKEVELANSRMIWSWSGAFTLREIALSGVDRKNSRITKSVPKQILTEAIEIIPVCKGVDLSPTEK
jgi:hypothetical protein